MSFERNPVRLYRKTEIGISGRGGMNRSFTLKGQIVDVIDRSIFGGTVTVKDGSIESVAPASDAPDNLFIMPGFIDAHIHIESSLLVPSEFARLAVIHGTVATVSDPHEIANVLGLEGVRFMIRNGNRVPFHFFFGASPCVPATAFETAGATLGPEEVEELFAQDGLLYLSEMMNYPGVLGRDPETMRKIAIAKKFGKRIDGHAPGLSGKEAQDYISAGISTDHECVTFEEAREKIRCGMNILIREGSAAKNYDALHPLLKSDPSRVMFCSDDLYPDELLKGHIDRSVKKSIALGFRTMDVLRAACYNPVVHYGLDVGLLRAGDRADFIVTDNLRDFNIRSTYINGEPVAENGKSLIPRTDVSPVNRFACNPKQPKDFAFPAIPGSVHVIEAVDGQLLTGDKIMSPLIQGGNFVSDLDRDLLKITVVNRYRDAPPAVAFITGFGIKKGAIASSVAHDSHNIICVGTSDEEICRAVNAVIEQQGGLSVVSSGKSRILPLPVAGIMSAEDGFQVAADYARIDRAAKELGTGMHSPFMTLSFMALLVIPKLKLSDRGLFDGTRFCFVD